MYTHSAFTAINHYSIQIMSTLTHPLIDHLHSRPGLHKQTVLATVYLCRVSIEKGRQSIRVAGNNGVV